MIELSSRGGVEKKRCLWLIRSEMQVPGGVGKVDVDSNVKSGVESRQD